MRGPASIPGPTDSYPRIVLSLLGVLGVMAALAIVRFAKVDPRSVAVVPTVVTPISPAPVVEVEPPAPSPPPPIPLDRAAVARAEEALHAARRDRARAEARAKEAADALASASTEAAAQSLALRTLPSRVHDPSTRIARATTRGGFLRAERDRLKGEVNALAKAPRPRRKALIDQTPVAQVTDGEEFHFEVRRDRVTVIDLEKLLDQVKIDARIQVRRAFASGSVTATVGPVGSFSLRYELGRTIPDLGDVLELRGATIGLRGWELVPESEQRGEAFAAAFQPASSFARAINRLDPERATITMWVYPDGFALYRKLRDVLHERGFMVAARPLPEGMAIRGSPSGTASASQ